MEQNEFQTEVSEPLMEMNNELTTENENLDEVLLEGKLGFHIFADAEPESLLSGLQKEVFTALEEKLEMAMLGGLREEDIRRDYGEVTPRTVRKHVVAELEHAGFSHPITEFVAERVQESLSERQQELQETGTEQGADA